MSMNCIAACLVTNNRRMVACSVQVGLWLSCLLYKSHKFVPCRNRQVSCLTRLLQSSPPAALATVSRPPIIFSPLPRLAFARIHRSPGLPQAALPHQQSALVQVLLGCSLHRATARYRTQVLHCRAASSEVQPCCCKGMDNIMINRISMLSAEISYYNWVCFSFCTCMRYIKGASLHLTA